MLIRILTNYLHALMIFTELSIKSSYQFDTVFSIMSSSHILISLECLYLATENHVLFLITQSNSYEILFVGTLPIAFGLFFSLIWLVYLLVKRYKSGTGDWKYWIKDLRLRVSANFFIIVQVLYPSISNYCFTLFDCTSGPNH